MEFEIVKKEGKIVGFDLHGQGKAEDETFCQELPHALMQGIAEISIIGNKTVIKNPECSNSLIDGLPNMYSFEISKKETEALRKFFDSPYTQPTARLGGFGRKTFEARFKNEWLENRQKSRYPGSGQARKNRKKLKRVKKRK